MLAAAVLAHLGGQADVLLDEAVPLAAAVRVEDAGRPLHRVAHAVPHAVVLRRERIEWRRVRVLGGAGRGEAAASGPLALTPVRGAIPVEPIDG